MNKIVNEIKQICPQENTVDNGNKGWNAKKNG